MLTTEFQTTKALSFRYNYFSCSRMELKFYNNEDWGTVPQTISVVSIL